MSIEQILAKSREIACLREALEEIGDAAKAQSADPLEWATWAHELARAALGEETADG